MSDHKIYPKVEMGRFGVGGRFVHARDLSRGTLTLNCPNATYKAKPGESFNPDPNPGHGACIAARGGAVFNCIYCVGEGNDFVVCSHERGIKPEVPAPWFRLLPQQAAGGHNE